MDKFEYIAKGFVEFIKKLTDIIFSFVDAIQ